RSATAFFARAYGRRAVPPAGGETPHHHRRHLDPGDAERIVPPLPCWRRGRNTARAVDAVHRHCPRPAGMVAEWRRRRAARLVARTTGRHPPGTGVAHRCTTATGGELARRATCGEP